MIYNFKSIRKQFLGLPLSEANFKKRGFEEGGEAQQRLELVAKTVVNGYNIAIENGLTYDLETISKTVKIELEGFFNEGVGMGLYTLDCFSLRSKNRFWQYIKENNQKHEYMAYIGAGLASGVFKRPFKSFMKKACPMSGCLILDGIGFYYAMFKTKRTILKQYVPKDIVLNDFFLNRYDNGIGRAMWFYASGEPEKIEKTISKFPEKRQAALWSGIGLAAAYAGGVSSDKLYKLKKFSKQYASYLAQGAFLAAHTRHRAGNPNSEDIAVQVLTGSQSLDCHKFAMLLRIQLEGKHFVEEKYSFQVFLKEVRAWLQSENKSNHMLKSNSLATKI